jgi:CHAD domain-containing protein
MPISAKTQELRLLPGESPFAGLQRIAAHSVHQTLTQITFPSRVRANDLHDVRVCIKFLRALLRLVRPMLDKAVFRSEDKRLKAVSAQLSFRRDVTVARRTLQRLAARAGATPEDKSALGLALRGFGLDRANRTPASESLEAAMREAGRELAQTAEAILAVVPRNDASKRIEEALRKTYRSGRRRMRKAVDSGTDEDFHDWRKSAKYLFFQLRTLQPLWPAHLEQMVEQLNELQKRAGLHQDLVVLRALLAEGPTGSFGNRASLKVVNDILTRRSRRLRKQCLSLGRQIYAREPRLFIQGITRHIIRYEQKPERAKIATAARADDTASVVVRLTKPESPGAGAADRALPSAG